MRTQKHLILAILILAAALWLLAAPAAAEATRTYFTVIETCPSMGQWQIGKITFPDGNMHIRGATFACQDVGSIPEVTGTNHILLNANFDKNGFGPLWGTFHTETSEGAWDGTWTQKVTVSGSSIRAVGQGSGKYQGLQEFVFVENGVATGYILNPGGK